MALPQVLPFGTPILEYGEVPIDSVGKNEYYSGTVLLPSREATTRTRRSFKFGFLIHFLNLLVRHLQSKFIIVSGGI